MDEPDHSSRICKVPQWMPKAWLGGQISASDDDLYSTVWADLDMHVGVMLYRAEDHMLGFRCFHVLHAFSSCCTKGVTAKMHDCS